MLFMSPRRRSRSIVLPFLSTLENVNALDNEGWTALWQATYYGRGALVSELLRLQADPNVRNRDSGTILAIAAQEGHLQIIREIVKAGAKHVPDELPDERGDVGYTPLHMAAQEGFVDVVKFFLWKICISPSITTRAGFKPVDIAK